MSPSHEASLALLHGHLSAIQPITAAEWSDFAQIWQPFEASRRQVLTTAGDTERFIYFVLDGVQHAYALDEQGQSATLVFTYPPSFSGVADSLLLQQPSRYFFETLTPSVFLRAHFDRLDAVLRQHHGLERLFRLAISHTLAGVLLRQTELQSLNATQRMQRLASRSPHLFQLVPHKYIASYLGMDATNFSKILGQVKF